jgi:hypothetical protein
VQFDSSYLCDRPIISRCSIYGYVLYIVTDALTELRVRAVHTLSMCMYMYDHVCICHIMFIAISYTSVIHIHLYRCMQCSGYRELNRSRYLDKMYEPDIIQVQNRESKQWHYVRLAPMPTTRSLSSVPETQGAPQLDVEFQTLAVLHGRAPGEPLCHDQGVRWAAQR